MKYQLGHMMFADALKDEWLVLVNICWTSGMVPIKPLEESTHCSCTKNPAEGHLVPVKF